MVYEAFVWLLLVVRWLPRRRGWVNLTSKLLTWGTHLVLQWIPVHCSEVQCDGGGGNCGGIDGGGSGEGYGVVCLVGDDIDGCVHKYIGTISNVSADLWMLVLLFSGPNVPASNSVHEGQLVKS